MSIPISCPTCGAAYNLNDGTWGKTVRCRECKATFRVDTDPSREARTAGSGRARPRPPRDEDEDYIEEPPPRRRQNASGSNDVVKVLLIVGGVVCFLVLLTCGGYWYFVWRVTSTFSNTFNNVLTSIGPPKDVAEAVEILKSGNQIRHHFALDWLARAQPEEARRTEVARLVERFLDDRSLRGPAANALATWGTPESVPALLRSLDDDAMGHPEVIAALGKLKDPRAVGPLARRLTNFFDRGEASKALRNLGPVAEPEVLRYVQDRDQGVQLEACKILKYIGTQQSVPLLQQVAMDRNRAVAEEARAALEAIAERH